MDTKKKRTAVASKTQKSTPTDRISKEQKKNWAKSLYLASVNRSDICDQVSVDSRTLNKWIEDEKWDLLRASKSMTPTERREKILRMLDKMLDNAILESDDPSDKESLSKISDSISKLGKMLEQLDDNNIASMAIEVFSRFGQWLMERTKTDRNITVADCQKITQYQNEFIKMFL